MKRAAPSSSTPVFTLHTMHAATIAVVVLPTPDLHVKTSALLLSILPEALRYVATPLQDLSGGRIDAAILRQLLIALTMVLAMLWRPQGLWPKPKTGVRA